MGLGKLGSWLPGLSQLGQAAAAVAVLAVIASWKLRTGALWDAYSGLGWEGQAFTAALLAVTLGAGVVRTSPLVMTWVTLGGGPWAVRLLVRWLGAGVNVRTRNGTTALHAAAREGRSEVVAELVQRGAALDLQTREGVTPLIFACMEGHPETVQELMSAGAAADLRMSDGTTPLMAAATLGRAGAARALLEWPEGVATLDLQRRDGATALHCAAGGTGNAETVRALVEAGAALGIKDRLDLTAQGHAEGYGRSRVAGILRTAARKKR